MSLSRAATQNGHAGQWQRGRKIEVRCMARLAQGRGAGWGMFGKRHDAINTPQLLARAAWPAGVAVRRRTTRQRAVRSTMTRALHAHMTDRAARPASTEVADDPGECPHNAT